MVYRNFDEATPPRTLKLQLGRTMEELVERWHAFAGQTKEAIAAQFDDASQALLREVVTTCLVDTSVEGDVFASADEFAQCVLDLRKNEKAWSRALGELLLKTREQFDAGLADEAKESLRQFRGDCPWRLFAEIADTQVHNFGG